MSGIKKEKKYTWEEWIRQIADRDGNFFVLIKRNGEYVDISGQGFKFIDSTTKQEIIDSVRSLASKATKATKSTKVTKSKKTKKI